MTDFSKDKYMKLISRITYFIMSNQGIRRILLYRTLVKHARDIKHIAALFTLCPQIYKWNIDMEDWEKVLRIECQGITPTEISKALRAINIYAQELE